MKSLIVYSGGMDSFTLLHQTIAANAAAERAWNEEPITAERSSMQFEVAAISFYYGQRHSRELIAARQVTKRLGIVHHVVDITDIGKLVSNSSLTSSKPVPEGHYSDETMKSTVVPGRNTIMLAIAMGVAENDGFDCVGYGAHSGDHAIYPDCRPSYVNAMRHTFTQATDGKVALYTPYINIDKGQILTIGLHHKLNYGQSWTCYNGGAHPCGKCGACVERAEAFAHNDAVDPLIGWPEVDHFEFPYIALEAQAMRERGQLHSISGSARAKRTQGGE